MLILAALVLAVPQSMVTRDVTVHAVDVQFDNGAGVTGVTGSVTASAYTSAYLPGRPAPGVELFRLFGDGFVQYTNAVRLRAATDFGTTFSYGGVSSSSACGGVCDWGPWDTLSDGFSQNSPSGVSYSIGEVWESEHTIRDDFGFTRERDPSQEWADIVANPFFSTHMYNSTGWSSTNQADVLEFNSEAHVELNMTAMYELEPTDSVAYCDSQANSTGAMANLAAFGSREAGTEYLTIRVNDVPQGSAGLLFAASAPANVPGVTSTLCVGGAVQRLGGVQVATTGVLQFDIDLIGRLSGSIVYFQSYFRDPIYSVCASEGALVRVE